ncbi:patatin-like phospholipase family protein [Acetohalobium arabaticum]|uniref:Lysophospholipase n=1 Tax=Acetohalobium arabaticum (strain ATCC 49924 / DSM 5501 / Z-7288) TaxID=574087 RepID=D9QPT5_ACEAZ|nr:patatin-like phospholipase family protein [Acetohalobium arabaticum]ADL12526.1 Lysophospholipase [Acetohalobium arabaticum DSM 5501]
MGEERPTVGLALGAGAAKGIAHIGVLQVLKEADINIDYLAGTSIGSMIGGFYAAGLDLKWIERIAYQINWDLLTDFTVPRQGLIAGKKVKAFVQLLTKSKRFSDLDIPFAAVATDIEKGEEVILQDGLVADAIRASTSIPGVYVPYRIDNRLLVDGAILNRIPVNVVQNLGADVIIGVDVGFDFQENKVNNIFDVILTSIRIMEQEVFDKRIIEADVLIRPEVGYIAPQDLDRAEEAVAAGIEAAQKALPQIKESIERWEEQ